MSEAQPRPEEPDTYLDEATALKQAEVLRDNPDFMDAISRRAIVAGQLGELEPQFDEVKDAYETADKQHGEKLQAALERSRNSTRFGSNGIFYDMEPAYRNEKAVKQEIEDDAPYQEHKRLASEINRLRQEMSSAEYVAKKEELETLYDARPGWVAMLERDKAAIYAWDLFGKIHEANPNIMDMPISKWMDTANKFWPVENDANFATSLARRARDAHEGIKAVGAGGKGEGDELKEKFSLEVNSPKDVLDRITGLISNTKHSKSRWDTSSPPLTDDWYEKSAISTDVFDVEKERESFMESITSDTTIGQMYERLTALAERVATAREENAQPFVQKAQEARQELVDWHPHPPESTTEAA